MPINFSRPHTDAFESFERERLRREEEEKRRRKEREALQRQQQYLLGRNPWDDAPAGEADPELDRVLRGESGMAAPSPEPEPPRNWVSEFIEKEQMPPESVVQMQDAFQAGDIETMQRQNELLLFTNNEKIPHWLYRKALRKSEEAKEAAGTGLSSWFADPHQQVSIDSIISGSDDPVAKALELYPKWLSPESLSDSELEDLQEWGVSEDGRFEIQFTPTYNPTPLNNYSQDGTRTPMEERQRRANVDPFFYEIQRRAGAVDDFKGLSLEPAPGPEALRAKPYTDALASFIESEMPVVPSEPRKLRQVGERPAYLSARELVEQRGQDPSLLSDDLMASSLIMPTGEMEPVYAPPDMPRLSQAEMMRLPFGDPRALTKKEHTLLSTASDSVSKILAGGISTVGSMALIPDIVGKITGIGSGPEGLEKFAKAAEFQTRLINDGLSDLQKKADFDLAATRDLKEAISGLSPRAAWGMVMESLPFILASGATGKVSQGILGMLGRRVAQFKVSQQMASKLPELIRKASKNSLDAMYWGSGEGIVSMAAAYAEMPDRDAHSARMAALTGFGVGLVGGVSNRMASKFGLDDVDQLWQRGTPTGRILDDAAEEGLELLGRPVRGPGSRGYVVEAVGRQAVLPSLIEGAEEYLQSGFEQAMNNLEGGRRWSEGTGRAAALGAITGALASGSRLAPPKFIKAVSEQLEASKRTPEWMNTFQSEAKKALADITYASREVFDAVSRDRQQRIGEIKTPEQLRGSAAQRVGELMQSNQTVMTLSDASFDRALSNIVNGREMYEGVDRESGLLSPQLERGRERVKRLAAVMVDLKQRQLENLPGDPLASYPRHLEDEVSSAGIPTGRKKGDVDLGQLNVRQRRLGEVRQGLEEERSIWLSALENLNKDSAFGTKHIPGLQQQGVAVSLPDGVRSVAELEEGHTVIQLPNEAAVEATWNNHPDNRIEQADGTVVRRERPDANKTSTFTLEDVDDSGNKVGTRTTYTPTAGYFNYLARTHGFQSSQEDVLAHEFNVRTAEDVIEKTPDIAEEIVTAALNNDTSKVTPETGRYAGVVVEAMGPVDTMSQDVRRELSREIVSHELSRRAMGETPQRRAAEDREMREAVEVGTSTSGVSVAVQQEIPDQRREEYHEKVEQKRQLENEGRNKTKEEKAVLRALSDDIAKIENEHGGDVITSAAEIAVTDPEKSSFAPEEAVSSPYGLDPETVFGPGGLEEDQVAVAQDLTPPLGDKQVGDIVEYEGGKEYRIERIWTEPKPLTLRERIQQRLSLRQTPENRFVMLQAVEGGDVTIIQGSLDSSNPMFDMHVGDSILWGGPKGKVVNREQSVSDPETGRIKVTLTIEPLNAPEGTRVEITINDHAAGPEWEQKVQSHRILNAVKVPELVRVISRILTAAHDRVSLRKLPQYPRVVELKDANGQVRWYRGLNQMVALPKDFYVMFREHLGDKANAFLNVETGTESGDLNGTVELPFEPPDAQNAGLSYLVAEAREVAQTEKWNDGKDATDAEVTAAQGFVAKYDEVVQSVQHLEMEFDPRAFRETREITDDEGNVVAKERIDANTLEVAALLAHELGHLISWVTGRQTGNDPFINKMRAVWDAGMLTKNKYLDRKWHGKDLKTEEARLRKQAEDLSFLWRPFDLESSRQQVDQLRERGEVGKANKLAETINYRLGTEELYADFFSVLMVNPALAWRIAPDLVQRFLDHLDRKPEAKTALIQTWDTIENGETQNQRRADLLASYQTVEKSAKDAMNERIAAQQITPAKTWNGLMREYVSRHWPVEKKFRDWLVKTGKVSSDVADQFNIPNLLAKATVIQGSVTAYVHEYFGRLTEDLRKANVGYDDFGVVVHLARIASGDRLGLMSPLGISNQNEARELLQDILNGYSEDQREAIGASFDNEGNLVVEQGSFLDQFSEAIWHVTDWAYRDGLFPKRAYDEMLRRKDSGRYYATFQSLYHITEDLAPDFHPSEGMFEPTRNPVTATMLKMASIVRAVEWNNIKRGVVQQMRRMYRDEVILPSEMDQMKGEKDVIRYKNTKKHGNATMHLVYFREDGKSRAFYVAKEIAESLNKRAPSFNNTMLTWLKGRNEKLFRPLFTVANPGFQLVNLWRDFWRFYRNLSHEGRSVGFFEAFKRYYQAHGMARTRVFGEKREEGFSVFGSRVLKRRMQPAARERARKDAEDVILMGRKMAWGITINDFFEGKHEEDPSAVTDASMLGVDSDSTERRLFGSRHLGRVYDFVKHTGDYIETLPKAAAAIHIAETKYGGDMTLLDDHDIRFIRERVGSPDFLAGGTQKGWSNELFLFSNAMIQGWRSDIETARDPETKSGFMWKMLGTSILPKTLMLIGARGLAAPLLTGVKQALLAVSPDEWDDEAEWLGSKLEQAGERYVRLYSNMSTYDMMNYMILPLWEDDVSGQVVLLRIPMGDTQRVIGGLYYSLLNAVPYGRDREMMAQQVETARTAGLGGWFDTGVSALSGAAIAGGVNYFARRNLGMTGGWMRTMAWSGFGAAVGGALAQRVAGDERLADIAAQLTGYAGEQLPGITPTLGIVPGIGRYLYSASTKGRINYGPYDRYRGLRPIITQQEHTAGILGLPSKARGATFGDDLLTRWETATGRKFLGWVSNEAGGGIVQRVQFYPQATERGALQGLVQSPFISNILGRFLRWSDYGVAESRQQSVQRNEIEQEKDGLYQNAMVAVFGKSVYGADAYNVRRALGADGWPDQTQKLSNMYLSVVANAAAFNYEGTITDPTTGKPMEFKSMFSFSEEERRRMVSYDETARSIPFFNEALIGTPDEGNLSSRHLFPAVPAAGGGVGLEEGERGPNYERRVRREEVPTFAIPLRDPTSDSGLMSGRSPVRRGPFRGWQRWQGLTTEAQAEAMRPLAWSASAHPETQVTMQALWSGRGDSNDRYMLAPSPESTPGGQAWLSVLRWGTSDGISKSEGGTPVSQEMSDRVMKEANAINVALSLRRDQLAETTQKMHQEMSILDNDDFAYHMLDPRLAENRYQYMQTMVESFEDTPEGNLGLRNRFANLTIYLPRGTTTLDSWVDAKGDGIGNPFAWDAMFGSNNVETFRRRMREGQEVWDATPIDDLRLRPDISLGDDVNDDNRPFVR